MKIRVATIQMKSLNDDYEGNLSRAEEHINDALNREAKLILLPELALAGYTYTDSIWKMAESLKGRTYQWLIALCKKHGVYIGTCILENYQGDFYDTFILVGPEKDALWAHRKIEPAGYEAYFFKGAGMNTNVFNTPIGRIGVAICFDTSKTHTIYSLMEARPEILLIPYSCPHFPSYFPKKDGESWLEVFLNTPKVYAQYLHAPVVSSNKTGRFTSPIPGVRGLKADWDFISESAIVDKNANVISSISKEAGALVEQVELGNTSISVKKDRIPKGRWLFPYTWKIRLITDISLKLGQMRYRWSKRRKRASS